MRVLAIALVFVASAALTSHAFFSSSERRPGPGKAAGIKVPDVATLVSKLKNDAKVI